MLFNSLAFALFLPAVVAAWAIAPAAGRRWVLLVASYVFYCTWKPEYGLLMAATTTLDWFVGMRIEDAPTVAGKRAWLTVTLCSNLGVLFLFKYWNLLNGSAGAVAVATGLGWPVPMLDLVLPVGISFYTFQAMSTAIDVYRGNLKAIRSLWTFALFVSFFPQLVAGPIERATTLVPQLMRLPGFDLDRMAKGLRLAAWGMFKKVVVADRLRLLVDHVYEEPTAYSGFAIVIATIFFSWQVYCDFSGYSDIAVGVARIFGVELMNNFDHPYGSRSMTEMWTRWHVSLTTWFRDYLYHPLGGNRVSQPRWVFNVMVVFVLSGLWHGAEWRFALWGALNGVALLFDRWTKPLRDRASAATGLASVPWLHAAVAIASTQVLWWITIVPFRARSATDTWTLYTRVGDGWAHFGDPVALGLFLNRVDLDPWMFGFCVLLIPVVEVVETLRRRPAWVTWLAERATATRWGLDYALVFGVLLLGHWVDSPFIYFQF
ncbi:MAG: MBOAT family protein [Alphaproteobacteria bacterium]|nr:MBOAT family protein [Alphaproteobacteria bacterium]MCB9695542.1 MBOAT family protein [Alphaproteobacteria bacterium]